MIQTDSNYTQQIITNAYHTIDTLLDDLAQGEYAELQNFEQACQSIIQSLQAVPVTDVQPFIKEFEDISMRLTHLRDAMVEHREAIRQKLEDADKSSHAAKAYLKSTMTSKKS